MGVVIQFSTRTKVSKHGTAVCPRCGKTRLVGGTHAGANTVRPCYGLKGSV